MPDSPPDEDSRAASVGLARSNINSSRPGSRGEPANPNKRQRRNDGKAGSREVQDFVPRGASFSADALEVDPEDDTSSSGSDSSDSGDGDESQVAEDDHAPEQHTQSSNPQSRSALAANWNNASKGAIRTTLSRGGKQQAKKEESRQPKSQFETVNNQFWRSRSDSASSAGGDQNQQSSENRGDDESMGEAEGSEVDSDDSELDSEADDSIMLNISGRNGHVSPREDDYDPESLSLSNGPVNGKAPVMSNGTAEQQSKEDTLRQFYQKYPMAPGTLADLERDDMESQARLLYYDRDIHDINLQLPITCTECMREGHLAPVCPYKECVHCGAWNRHQSSFCPTWRRCQRCRERGHDQAQCPSSLKGSASETPCDLCGSPDHLELQCDFIWKQPQPEPPSGPVLVSISCAHCTSNRHLIGDCPSLPKPMPSSSWTLRGIDPNMVTNINSVVSGRSGNGSGLRIRGRADPRSPSPDSDDMLSRPDRRQPVGRNAGGRPNIRFGSGIGRNKNLAPAGPSRPGDFDSRSYRDRQDYGGPPPRSRQRSLSPRGSNGRGRGRDSWQPSRGRGKGPPPPPRGRGGGGGRGGRGGSKRGGGDAYRPMPSAAKKAWDRYRL